MGLKIPRSKGRAGSIPASGTKQIKGLHEILHAGPLFFTPQKFSQLRNSNPPPFVELTWPGLAQLPQSDPPYTADSSTPTPSSSVNTSGISSNP